VYGLHNGKWVRQHIPKKKNNMLSSPVHPLSGMDKQGRKVRMRFFRPARIGYCIGADLHIVI